MKYFCILKYLSRGEKRDCISNTLFCNTSTFPRVFISITSKQNFDIKKSSWLFIYVMWGWGKQGTKLLRVTEGGTQPSAMWTAFSRTRGPPRLPHPFPAQHWEEQS